jgi:hypothetical protein
MEICLDPKTFRMEIGEASPACGTRTKGKFSPVMGQSVISLGKMLRPEAK